MDITSIQKICIIYQTNTIKVGILWIKKHSLKWPSDMLMIGFRAWQRGSRSKDVINSFKIIKWGIVHLCTYYSVWDMIKNVKNIFLKIGNFVKKICQKTSHIFQHFCHLQSQLKRWLSELSPIMYHTVGNSRYVRFKNEKCYIYGKGTHPLDCKNQKIYQIETLTLLP